MTDAELLAEFRTNRSSEALSTLIVRHSAWVYAAARRRVRDTHLAQDVTQAVFLLLIERAERIRSFDRLPGWLMQTTLFVSDRLVRSERRRLRRERQAFSEQHKEGATSDSLVGDSEIIAVEKAMLRLKGKDRSLLIMRFYQGYSVAQIAKELQIAEPAVRKRLERALDRLQPLLAQCGVSGDSLSGILAGLIPINYVASPALKSFTPRAASPRAHSLVKGINQMRMWNRFKVGGSVAALLVAAITGIVLACSGNGPQLESVPPLPAPAAEIRRTVETPDLLIVASKDHTTLTGYSKVPGSWQSIPIDASNFDLDHVIATPGVGVYYDSHRVFAFSPDTSTWDSIDLPTADAIDDVQPMIADHIAAVGLHGLVYAFSTQTGKWVPLNLPKVSTTIPPIVSPGSVKIEAEGQIYLFSNKTGKWSPGF